MTEMKLSTVIEQETKTQPEAIQTLTVVPPQENIPETFKDIVNITNEHQEAIETEEKLPHLRPRLVKFCEAILQNKSQAEAYKIAGFKVKNDAVAFTLGNRMLNNDEIKKYVEIRQNELTSKLQRQTEATVLRTITELARIGYADPKDLFDNDGNLIEIKEINEDTRRAIASVEVETRYEGKGEDRQAYNTTKIKFWNKNDALKTIATHLGMLVERLRVEQHVMIPDVQRMALKDRRALISQLEDQLPAGVKVN